jgi:hypothetical protein
MSEIHLSAATHARLVAFQGIVRTIMGKDMTVDDSADMLIRFAINKSIDMLVQAQSKEALAKSFDQVASRRPEEVFDFIAKVLKIGGELGKLKDQLGLRPPKESAGG